MIKTDKTMKTISLYSTARLAVLVLVLIISFVTPTMLYAQCTRPVAQTAQAPEQNKTSFVIGSTATSLPTIGRSSFGTSTDRLYHSTIHYSTPQGFLQISAMPYSVSSELDTELGKRRVVVNPQPDPSDHPNGTIGDALLPLVLLCGMYMFYKMIKRKEFQYIDEVNS